MELKKVLYYGYYLVMIGIISYMGLSFADVLTHNLDSEPICMWNMFRIFLG